MPLTAEHVLSGTDVVVTTTSDIGMELDQTSSAALVLGRVVEEDPTALMMILLGIQIKLTTVTTTLLKSWVVDMSTTTGFATTTIMEYILATDYGRVFSIVNTGSTASKGYR